MARPPGDVPSQVAQLRRLLEQELGRQVRPWQGCWPLAVAIAGVILGVALLLRAL